MSDNRLKIMRKVKRKTQAEVAQVIGITQNTYSYWENGKVKIDNESLRKLAEYYGVTLDFLAGRRYRVTTPVSEWRPDLREDYSRGDEYLKVYYDYLYGNIVYIDNSASFNVQNSVIGDSNTNCCSGISNSGLESMLLHFFNQLSVDKQFEVLEFAKKKCSEDK